MSEHDICQILVFQFLPECNYCFSHPLLLRLHIMWTVLAARQCCEEPMRPLHIDLQVTLLRYSRICGGRMTAPSYGQHQQHQQKQQQRQQQRCQCMISVEERSVQTYRMTNPWIYKSHGKASWHPMNKRQSLSQQLLPNAGALAPLGSFEYLPPPG